MILIGVALVLLAVYLFIGGQPSAAFYTDANGTRFVVSDAVLVKQPGDTPEIAAIRIRSWSGTDKDFVENIYRYAITNIKYTYMDNSFAIIGADRALREGYGDCSEIAVLSQYMLETEGIDARLISGIDHASGIPHDTVEIHIGHYPWILDGAGLPMFRKLYDGLWPGEYVVN